jgi:hypothetical protein
LKLGGLSRHFFLQTQWASAARRPFDAIPQLPDVNLQFRYGAAEGVAVHPQLSGCPALIAFVLLEDRQYELLLEFPYSLGIENIASIHLQDQSF